VPAMLIVVESKPHRTLVRRRLQLHRLLSLTA
jgi:hypothetical protein